MTPTRVIARLIGNVSVDIDTGCVVSLYSTGSHGYSQIGWVERGERYNALGHRVAWEAAHGPIPPDMTIDHICRNRRCIAVDHLRLLPNVENATFNGNKVKTHCKRGHEFTDDNTWRNARGHRRCRTCARLAKGRT